MTTTSRAVCLNRISMNRIMTESMRCQNLRQQCDALMRRIAQRKAQHEGVGALTERLIGLRARQLRAEIRLERKQGKVA
jgi:hypothetical protein